MDLALSKAWKDESVVFQLHSALRVGSCLWSVSCNVGLPIELSEGESTSASRRSPCFFVKTSTEGYKQIWSIGIDGSSPAQVSSESYNDTSLAWHPSGSLFATNEGRGTTK